MNVQPFRLVKPLSRTLHRVMLQVIEESPQTVHHVVVEAMHTYVLYEQVPHAEMLQAFSAGFDRARHGDTVLTSDALFVPLTHGRRLIASLQRFPSTTTELETLKRSTEAKAVQDILRLSTDDLSTADVLELWRCAAQCTEWECVEAICAHFPLAHTLGMQSAEEYRELLMAVCTTSHGPQHRKVSPSPDQDRSSNSTPSVVTNTQRFLEDIFGVEEAGRRCREALMTSSQALRLRNGSSVDHSALLEARDAHALTGIVFAAAQERCWAAHRRSVFKPPITEADWVACIGDGAGDVAGFAAASEKGSAPPSPQSFAGSAFGVWGRHLAALHARVIPNCVRAAFSDAVDTDLVRFYRRGDVVAVALAYLTLVPHFSREFRDVDMRAIIRHHHNGAMAKLFWRIPSVPGSMSDEEAPKNKQRGKWTQQEEVVALPTASSSPAAASFSLSFECALSVMLAEVCIQEEGKPLPEVHLPAMESMLRTVLLHVRSHMGRSSSGAAVRIPVSLWEAWAPLNTAHLAMVLSALQDRMTDLAGHRSASTTLSSLVAEGLELLRPLMSMEVMTERGSALLLTQLLCHARGAILAVGGASLEAELQELALAHIQDGFSRLDVCAIADCIEKRLADDGKDDARARNVVQRLRAAEVTLPLRRWL